ncbi:tRNA pseudouridine(55) synthase TruB [Sphingomicrobium sp. XHP0239]|uniref:tRNA pseudouridine(55) synthase TruB n=1 Tax=Sphingomicrobium maritimum TaxID=3133972 RepID=UPI0031CC951F
MLHGWIILDKPVGIGSTPCVSRIKRGLREAGFRKPKVGHGGTLDPLASGVLPIAIGEATKLAGRMLDASKDYTFTIRFGEETETLDTEGAVIATSDHRPTRQQLADAMVEVVGTIEQMPPAYSALKVDGKRAYERARAGEAVVLDSRTVTIHSLTVCDPPDDASPDDRLEEITLTASVSKGTYIRSLARDIALAVGSRGHVTMLRRTRAGPFGLAQAISLDKWDEMAKARSLNEGVLPLTAGLDDIPALFVTPDEARALKHGQRLDGHPAPPGQHLAMEGDTPIALVEVVDGEVAVLRGFNL